MTEQIDDNDPVITIRDVMAAGFCAPGFARWVKSYGLSYKDFKEGRYRVSDFEQSEDGYAQQVVRYIKAKRGRA